MFRHVSWTPPTQSHAAGHWPLQTRFRQSANHSVTSFLSLKRVSMDTSTQRLSLKGQFIVKRFPLIVSLLILIYRFVFVFIFKDLNYLFIKRNNCVILFLKPCQCYFSAASHNWNNLHDGNKRFTALRNVLSLTSLKKKKYRISCIYLYPVSFFFGALLNTWYKLRDLYQKQKYRPLFELSCG